MQYRANIEFELGWGARWLWGIAVSIVVCLYVFVVYTRLSAQNYYDQGVALFKKAEAANEGLQAEMMVYKATRYKKALLLVSEAIRKNKLSAEYSASYAQMLNAVVSDQRLERIFEAPSIFSRSGGIRDEIEKAYKEAILQNPAHYVTHAHLGMFYRHGAFFDEATAEFERATALDPQNLTLHAYLSGYYLSIEAWSRAFVHLGRSAYLNRFVFNLVEAHLFDNLMESIPQEERIGIFRRENEIVWRFPEIDALIGLRFSFPFGVRYVLDSLKFESGTLLNLGFLMVPSGKKISLVLEKEANDADSIIMSSGNVHKNVSQQLGVALSETTALEFKDSMLSESVKRAMRSQELFITTKP